MKKVILLLTILLVSTNCFAEALHGPVNPRPLTVNLADGSSIVITDSDSDTLDVYDGAIPNIEFSHLKNHKGKMFESCTLNVGVADDGYASIYINPGVESHMITRISAEGKSYAFLYENPTVSGGIDGAFINTNRVINSTYNGSVSFNVTVSAAGTTLACDFLAGGTGPRSIGGSGADRVVEWILSPTATYLIRVQNKAGSAKDIFINTILYEED